MNKKTLIIAGISISIFIGLSFLITTIDDDQISRINSIIQLAYTLVTIILVGLTYLVVRSSQEQKHQSVQPYLVVGDMDYYEDDNEFEFNILNEGEGLARNIMVNVFDKNNVKVFTINLARLKRENDPKISALYSINNALSEIRKTINKNSNGMSSIHYDLFDPIEFKFDNKPKDKIELLFDISYESIYNKKYRSKIEVEYDIKEDEVINYKEKFID